jgi:hypothetical protein
MNIEYEIEKDWVKKNLMKIPLVFKGKPEENFKP